MNRLPALNLLVFSGSPWETALEQAAALGFVYIEPVYISKYDPLLREDYFTAANARRVSGTLKQSGLGVRSVAAHMDMGLPETVAVFGRRMEFARNLGADIIITNSSHSGNTYRFVKNMDVLSGLAGRLGLTITLENPGDGTDYIINNAREGRDLLAESGWESVKLNYDFSNYYTLSGGAAAEDPGLADALPWLGHLHLKNIKQDGAGLSVCGLGEGIIDYARIFGDHPMLADLPASIELPVLFGYNKAFEFVPRSGEPPGLEEVSRMLGSSMIFLKNIFTKKTA